MALVQIATALVVFAMLTKFRAAYGKYSHEASTLLGPMVDARIAWAVQESPSLLFSGYYLLRYYDTMPLANKIALSLFAAHYANRTLLYPLQLRGGKPTPLLLVLLAFTFMTFNGYMQGAHHALVARTHAPVATWQLLAGAFIAITGVLINFHSDHVLRNLRSPGEVGYRIPRGGLFTWVSTANYFGEIVEWTGYAIMSNCAASSAFAIFTVCNIGPRGWQHHQWYIDHFGREYPRERFAVLPLLW